MFWSGLEQVFLCCWIALDLLTDLITPFPHTRIIKQHKPTTNKTSFGVISGSILVLSPFAFNVLFRCPVKNILGMHRCWSIDFIIHLLCKNQNQLCRCNFLFTRGTKTKNYKNNFIFLFQIKINRWVHQGNCWPVIFFLSFANDLLFQWMKLEPGDFSCNVYMYIW